MTSPSPVSTDHIDYLQRGLSFDPPEAPPSGVDEGSRRAWHVRSIGFPRKERPPTVRPDEDGEEHLLSGDALVGLYGNRVPVAFVVWSEPDGVAVHAGTWMADGSGAGTGDGGGSSTPAPETETGPTDTDLDRRSDLVRTALTGLYPAVDLEAAPAALSPAPQGGLVLGTPTVKPPDPSDEGLAWDRIFRATVGSTWAAAVLAEPVEEAAVVRQRETYTEELRRVQADREAGRTPVPLADQYSSLLETRLREFTDGLATGMWRTAVYLLGDEESFGRLASVWRGVFSGEESGAEPVRVWPFPDAGRHAAAWSIPDVPGADGPGRVRHPHEYQSLLTSRQLSAYVHLPHKETVGFAVNRIPEFDAVRPDDLDPETGDAVGVGTVVVGKRPTGSEYRLRVADLTRHALVAGVTGAGKTNTVVHLLRGIHNNGVPFLVVEPAKTEYRALLGDADLGGTLRVYTLGDEHVSPFRLNPFEVPEGTPVGTHVDLLRSVFSVSFGMWTPLPQVLEQCLHEVYRDRGWDLATGTNRRLTPGDDQALAYPTLSDLHATVGSVVDRLGYDRKVADDIRAALRTRIDGLRTGGKGRMLDVQRSLPMADLLDRPTVLELEAVGDDDDKAFIMGLLLVRLAEFRQTERRRAGEEGLPDGLRHLLVVEEAHRLLTNVGSSGREEAADPRAKAVESFANLLSEIRAYGQGVLVADQIPVKLAPEVIKNTNLKVAHRLVDESDRRAVAGAMAMTEPQTTALATLGLGEAAVFADLDDAPILVRVPEVETTPPDPDALAERMAAVHGRDDLDSVRDDPVFARHRGCVAGGLDDWPACDAAADLAEETGVQRTVGRIALSVLEDDRSLARLAPGLGRTVDAAVRPGIDPDVLRGCLVARAAERFAARRGAQSGWTYGETAEYGDALAAVLAAGLDRAVQSTDPDGDGIDDAAEPEADGIDEVTDDEDGGEIDEATATAVDTLRDLTATLHHRSVPPYSHCERICDHAPVCLYRRAVEDLHDDGDLDEAWAATFEGERDNTGQFPETWRVTLDAAQYLLDFDEAQTDALRRAALCYGQMALDRDGRLLPEARERILDDLLARGDAWRDWIESGDRREVRDDSEARDDRKTRDDRETRDGSTPPEAAERPEDPEAGPKGSEGIGAVEAGVRTDDATTDDATTGDATTEGDRDRRRPREDDGEGRR